MPEEMGGAKRPGLLVLLAGLMTSLGTLALMFALNIVAPDFHLMGWYVNFVLPVGAIAVGLAAGSGYGLASWLTGAKIGRGLMYQVLLLQVGCFFVAQYVEYLLIRNVLPPGITFWQYFDAMTRAFAWNNHGQPGQPFGVWGYGIRVLDICGFALGGMIVPAFLFAVPYCDACQVYMRTLDLGRVPAGIVPRNIKKKDTEGQQAYVAEQQAALEAGRTLINELLTTVVSKQPQKFADLLHEYSLRKKETEKLTTRMAVSLQHCRSCQRGKVVVKLNTGHGEAVQISDLTQTEVEPEFVRNVLLYRQDAR
jgi:hypothetical protein